MWLLYLLIVKMNYELWRLENDPQFKVLIAVGSTDLTDIKKTRPCIYCFITQFLDANKF